MSTRKNSLVIATVRIGFFPIIVIFPFRCFAEVIEGIADLLSLFQFTSQKVQAAMSFIEQIIAQIKQGATKNYGHMHSIPDRRQAIQFALQLAKVGDTVIVCGKGHEQSMNLDGKHEIPWSDVQVIHSLL